MRLRIFLGQQPLTRSRMKAAKQSFGQSVKILLVRREQTVTGLAAAVGYPRNSVSLAIHGRRKFPNVEAAIRKELKLQEAA